MSKAQYHDSSIVIIAHDGADFTRRCLLSLRQSQPLPREVIVVNNGSTDNTPAVIDEARAALEERGITVKSWANDENLGCSQARNEAWAEATCTYTLFLDNDTAVCTRNWLARLGDHLAADPELGVVGPKLLYPFEPHRIQCAGLGINPRGRVRFRGRGSDRCDPRYLRPARVPALISACWMMRTRFREDIGGLDPLFHPVQYEDIDYCFQLAEHGYYSLYTPTAEVYHFEGRTTAAAGKEPYVRTIAENSAKFRRKWRDAIRALPEDPNDFHWLTDEELNLSGDLSLATTALPLETGHRTT